MATSKANLSTLPTELHWSILWHSRELSLINVCRSMHDSLPSFSPLAQSLAVLAFSQVNKPPISPDAENYQGPITEYFLQRFHAALPDEAGLSFPLSQEQRAQLQHDVLCSGWWNINKFYAVHLFLYKHHLLSLESRVQNSTFWMTVSQSHSFKQYVRNVERHWSLWTTPQDSSTSENPPPIVPWKSMPSQSFNTGSRLTQALISPSLVHNIVAVEQTLIMLSQHAFVFQREWHGQECWNILRVNASGMFDIHGPGDAEMQRRIEGLENRRDRKNVIAYLPPRPLLTPPFTARKRGILVYLIQEAAGRCFVTDIPSLNNGATREDDEKLLHRAILEAIPLGDVPFFKILLILLQGQTPPHLSPDQSYSHDLIAPVPGSQDRAMVGLYMEKASWSQENMDAYVLAAMRSGTLDILTILLDVYSGYDKRAEDVRRFEERMYRLFDQSQNGHDVPTVAENRVSEDAIRRVVTRKVKMMRSNVRSSDYAKDKWLED